MYLFIIALLIRFYILFFDKILWFFKNIGYFDFVYPLVYYDVCCCE